MSEETWQWLCSLPFGAIMFSSRGSTPIPAILADGDLDGDWYFVCWDVALVESVRPRPPAAGDVNEAAAEKKAAVAQRPRREDGGWFASAQAHMSNVDVLREQHDIGRVYKAWEKRVEVTGMDDEDAQRLAAAYVQSLDRGKHGGAIDLPEHLIRQVRDFK
mmetsp:Transcript_91349/g.293393  ORF Transcript_91349/g.293393 Transcript_91349/m.293393 type:complete len:161 (+) Transcript_91349:1377-1859(+)